MLCEYIFYSKTRRLVPARRATLARHLARAKLSESHRNDIRREPPRCRVVAVHRRTTSANSFVKVRVIDGFALLKYYVKAMQCPVDGASVFHVGAYRQSRLIQSPLKNSELCRFTLKKILSYILAILISIIFSLNTRRIEII